jgi:hypothetical protein
MPSPPTGVGRGQGVDLDQFAVAVDARFGCASLHADELAVEETA